MFETLNGTIIQQRKISRFQRQFINIKVINIIESKDGAKVGELMRHDVTDVSSWFSEREGRTLVQKRDQNFKKLSSIYSNYFTISNFFYNFQFFYCRN